MMSLIISGITKVLNIRLNLSMVMCCLLAITLLGLGSISTLFIIEKFNNSRLSTNEDIGTGAVVILTEEAFKLESHITVTDIRDGTVYTFDTNFTIKETTNENN